MPTLTVDLSHEPWYERRTWTPGEPEISTMSDDAERQDRHDRLMHMVQSCLNDLERWNREDVEIDAASLMSAWQTMTSIVLAVGIDALHLHSLISKLGT